MTLKNCTKAELIFIINRFKEYAFSAGDYYLASCLDEVKLTREEKQLNEADKQAKIASDARTAYSELIKKHEGKKMPAEDTEKCIELLQIADDADEKYWKATQKFNRIQRGAEPR